MTNVPIWILIAALFQGCSAVDPNPVEEYLSLINPEPDAAQYGRIQPFVKLYSGLNEGPLAQKVDDTYAEELYFNDTLVTLHDRKSLLRYMEQTQSNLDSISLEVLGVQSQGDDVFVRWIMATGFTVMGQDRQVTSIGMSHLRFNSDNKIVLHQDYWDSMQGLYLHIPVIGGFLQWLKNGLHD